MRMAMTRVWYNVRKRWRGGGEMGRRVVISTPAKKKEAPGASERAKW